MGRGHGLGGIGGGTWVGDMGNLEDMGRGHGWGKWVGDMGRGTQHHTTTRWGLPQRDFVQSPRSCVLLEKQTSCTMRDSDSFVLCVDHVATC